MLVVMPVLMGMDMFVAFAMSTATPTSRRLMALNVEYQTESRAAVQVVSVESFASYKSQAFV